MFNTKQPAISYSTQLIGMKSLHKLLKSRKALAQLGKKLAEQNSLLLRIQALLEPALAHNCTGAILHGNVLSLLVESPVWASRLRYLAPQLQRQLKHQGLVLQRIHVKIALQGHRPSRQRYLLARPLSRQNAQLLESTAEGMSDDRLKAALLRLSRHTQ